MRAETPTNPTSRLRCLWLGAGLLWVVLVFHLSLRPLPPGPPPQGLDKFEHLLAYGVLMFWFAHLEPMRSGRWRLAPGLAGMGVAIECLHGLIGHRQFSVADMAANGVGVLAGWLAAPPRSFQSEFDLQRRINTFADHCNLYPKTFKWPATGD